MENVLSSAFWLDQTASALKAWAIIIPFILIVIVASEIRRLKLEKKIRGLKSYADGVDFRLKLAREANRGDAKAIADIRTEIDGLRQLVSTGTEASVVEPKIKEAGASAAALALASNTTDHILNAEKLALSGTRRHRLLTRDNDDELPSTAYVLVASLVAFLLLVGLIGISAN
jgi:hypothetical protein